MNGYIEEMMDGQKVVKVFCHEEESHGASSASCNESPAGQRRPRPTPLPTSLMPVNGNLGNISYALCAAVGAVPGHHRLRRPDSGHLVAFLILNKNFTQPVSQISQQINSHRHRHGRRRSVIFDLMDEEPETDDGYVELVNAEEDRTAACTRVRSAPTSGPGSTPTRRTAPSPTPGWRGT